MIFLVNSYYINVHIFSILDSYTTALKDKRNDMRARAKDPNGLARKLDCPDRTGAGGNTDNGPVARYFFEEKSRPHVVNLFDYDEGSVMKLWNFIVSWMKFNWLLQ